MMGEPGLGGRLPLLLPAKLRADAKALYDRLMAGRLGGTTAFVARTDAGALIGPFNACLHAPGMGHGFIDFHEAEERATSLHARIREVVILSVGAVWHSDYELYAHRAVAARLGFEPEVIDALANARPCAGLTHAEQAAQRFVLKLVGIRSVTDATYAEAEHLLGRDGVIAATFLAASYMGTCALLNAFSVPAPPA